MAFEVVWDKISLKFLDKLPKEEAKRIIKKVETANEDPIRYAERLVGSGIYKIRVGDYRVFVDIYYNPNIMKIRAIRHRSVAYQ